MKMYLSLTLLLALTGCASVKTQTSDRAPQQVGDYGSNELYKTIISKAEKKCIVKNDMGNDWDRVAAPLLLVLIEKGCDVRDNIDLEKASYRLVVQVSAAGDNMCPNPGMNWSRSRFTMSLNKINLTSENKILETDFLNESSAHCQNDKSRKKIVKRLSEEILKEKL